MLFLRVIYSLSEITHHNETEKIRQLLIIFKKNEGFLKSAGWMVSQPKSARWWGEVKNPEEVAITAILVQLSTWTSVQKIIKILREDGLTRLENLKDVEVKELEDLIRAVGLWKEKARRLIEFASKVEGVGGLRKLRRAKNSRDFLLSIKGIGKETADSISLFALNSPTIPISNYLRIVLGRVNTIDPKQSYEGIRDKLIMDTGDDIYDLKLLYAGVSSIGRITCKKEPKCFLCPLGYLCSFAKNHSKFLMIDKKQ